MSRQENLLILLSSAAMELCWMTTWAVNCSLLVSSSAFPMPMAAMAFIFSAGLTLGLDHIARMRWHRLLIHMVGFSSAVIVMWWLSRHYWPIDFNRGWQMGLQMGVLLAQPDPDAQWPLITFLAAWILLYWIAGSSWSRRVQTHQVICKRFDIGASLLFLLFYLKLLMTKRFDISVETSSSIYLLGFFFLFGLFSIGSAKNHAGISRDHRQGRHSSGGILPVFVIVILLLGIGSISLMLAYLETAAQLAFNSIKVAATPLVSWFAELLIFIFKASPDTADGLKDNVGQAPNASPPVESIVGQNEVFMQGAAFFYGIMVLLSSSIAFFMIYRWLTAHGAQKSTANRFSSATWIMRRFLNAMYVIAQRIRAMKEKKRVGYYYAALIKWGKHSGIVHRPNETPVEFAHRLTDRFPEVGRWVVHIVDHYNRCTYGGRPSSDTVMTKLVHARRILRSPRHWPMRIKSWIIRGKN